MCRRNTGVFFISRPFWSEMNIPEDLVLNMYKEYFGAEDITITSRKDIWPYRNPKTSGFLILQMAECHILTVLIN